MTQIATTVAGVNATGGAAAVATVGTLAILLLLLVPLCLVMSAAISFKRFLERRHYKRLADRAADADVLALLTWPVFERVVSDAFARGQCVYQRGSDHSSTFHWLNSAGDTKFAFLARRKDASS